MHKGWKTMNGKSKMGTANQKATQCTCGIMFMADADFCRKCGKKRQEVIQEFYTQSEFVFEETGVLCRVLFVPELETDPWKVIRKMMDPIAGLGLYPPRFAVWASTCEGSHLRGPENKRNATVKRIEELSESLCAFAQDGGGWLMSSLPVRNGGPHTGSVLGMGQESLRKSRPSQADAAALVGIVSDGDELARILGGNANPFLHENLFSSGAERSMLGHRSQASLTAVYPSGVAQSHDHGDLHSAWHLDPLDWAANPHLTHLVVVPPMLKDILVATIRQSVPSLQAFFSSRSPDSLVEDVTQTVRKDIGALIMSGTSAETSELAVQIKKKRAGGTKKNADETKATKTKGNSSARSEVDSLPDDVVGGRLVVVDALDAPDTVVSQATWLLANFATKSTNFGEEEETLLLNAWSLCSSCASVADKSMKKMRLLQYFFLTAAVLTLVSGAYTGTAYVDEPHCLAYWGIAYVENSNLNCIVTNELPLRSVCALLPVIIAILLKVSSKFKPQGKWALARAASDRIESEVFKYRCRVLDYEPTRFLHDFHLLQSSAKGHHSIGSSKAARSCGLHVGVASEPAAASSRDATPTQVLAQELQGVHAELMASHLRLAVPVAASTSENVKAASRQRKTSKVQPASRKEVTGIPVDDKFSKLTGTAYCASRLEPAMVAMEAQCRDWGKVNFVSQSLIVLLTLVAAVCGALKLLLFSPVMVALILTVDSVVRFEKVSLRISAGNEALTKLRSLHMWWSSLNGVSQAMIENKSHLVATTEDTLMRAVAALTSVVCFAGRGVAELRAKRA